MVLVYNLHIFHGNGNCIFTLNHHHQQDEHNHVVGLDDPLQSSSVSNNNKTNTDDEKMRTEMLYGFLWSLKSFCQRISPVLWKDNNTSFFTYHTSTYQLILMEMPTSLKFVLIVASSGGGHHSSSSNGQSLMDSSSTQPSSTADSYYYTNSTTSASSVATTTTGTDAQHNNSNSNNEYYKQVLRDLYRTVYVEYVVRNPILHPALGSSMDTSSSSIDYALFRQKVTEFVSRI